MGAVSRQCTVSCVSMYSCDNIFLLDLFMLGIQKQSGVYSWLRKFLYALVCSVNCPTCCSCVLPFCFPGNSFLIILHFRSLGNLFWFGITISVGCCTFLEIEFGPLCFPGNLFLIILCFLGIMFGSSGNLFWFGITILVGCCTFLEIEFSPLCFPGNWFSILLHFPGIMFDSPGNLFWFGTTIPVGCCTFLEIKFGPVSWEIGF